MKALSIQQPWAWAITNLGKNVENRDWWTKHRGEFLIHAGKKVDEDGYDWIISQGYNLPPIKDLPIGGIVGKSELIACLKMYSSKWFFGTFGFILENSIELPFMPCRGQLGFFDVDYKAS